MKFIACIILLILPISVYSEEQCEKIHIRDGIDFEFTNKHAKSRKTIKYRFCLSSGNLNLSQEVDDEIKIIPLQQEQEKIIKTLIAAAVKFNAHDSVVGVDGSTWCIKSQNGLSEIQGCFWQPTYNTKERKLEALVQLNDYLANASK